jgi:signal transduction histidine kinase
MSFLALDIHTAYLIVGFLYLLLPSFAWMVLREQRTLQVNLWCGGGFLLGSGLVLISFRDILSLRVFIVVSAVLVTVSVLLRIQSLCLDLDKPWRWRWLLLTWIVWFLIFVGLHLGLQNYVLRAQFMSIVAASCFFYIARLAWQIGHIERSQSAKLIGSVYFLVASASVVRCFNLMHKTGSTDLLQETESSQILAVAFLLSSIVGHFGYVGLALDRAKRREIKAVENRVRDEETLRLGKQIAQLDRQRSLGELSASLGHELNQPLAAILTNAQVAKRGLLKGSFGTHQLDELLDKIVYNTQRASQIIERIRDFIRPSDSRHEPVDLNQVVSEVFGLIADEAKKREVSFVLSLADQPVLVMGDSIQFSQIVLNVFRNAIDALIQTEKRQVSVVCCRQGDRAVIQVRDNGPGFTSETLQQIGMPFFTTKPNGLGMGISISRTIAMQHAGLLMFSNVDAADGGGALVTLNLPILTRTLDSVSTQPVEGLTTSGLNKRERDTDRVV